MTTRAKLRILAYLTAAIVAAILLGGCNTCRALVDDTSDILREVAGEQ